MTRPAVFWKRRYGKRMTPFCTTSRTHMIRVERGRGTRYLMGTANYSIKPVPSRHPVPRRSVHLKGVCRAVEKMDRISATLYCHSYDKAIVSFLFVAAVATVTAMSSRRRFSGRRKGNCEGF